MKVIILFIGLLLSNSTLQKKNKIDFVGTWKVTEVNVDKNSPMANNPNIMQLMKNSMGRVVFIFKADHHIQMSGAGPGQQVPDGAWHYDAPQKTLTIISGASSETKTINIVVTKDVKGQVYFKMLNAPITLKVYKQ